MTPAVIELLKLSIGLYLSIARTYDATTAELNDIYKTERDKFTKNTPDKLEDV